MAIKRRGVASGAAVAGALGLAALLHAQPNPPAAAQAEEDRRFVETACSACHDIGQVKARHKSAQDWAATVDKMIGLGAQVPEEERDRVIAYLATHQGLP